MTTDPAACYDTASDPALYALLFDPITLGSLRLRNRIGMAPMTRRMTPGTVPGQVQARYYARRAGVGLIITEGTHIDDGHSVDKPDTPALFDASHIAGWKLVTDAVHAAGGALACQLWHTGRHARDPIAPSPIASAREGARTPREMTRADMDDVAQSFAHAATCAQHAGFDAIELHGAHGYLLESFLSPATNHRTDDYGGTLANRMRFPLEVVRTVRTAVGPSYPIIYRFSQWKIEDFGAHTFDAPEELGTFVTALRDAGVDILHVSTRNATEPAYPNVHATRTLAGWSKQLSNLPTIAVGRVSVSASMGDAGEVQTTDPAPAAALVRDNEADLIAIGRSLIANPDWCDLVRAGKWRELKAYDKGMLEQLD
ncbi:MAG: hypothetical protein KDA20_10405 [Phycisphaerales bacterium]|nr:hypothetical protein [Phycisphaerales bacterium]